LTKIEFGLKTGQGGYSYEELVKLWSTVEELDTVPLEMFRDTVVPELR
jgi:hypothetical protein